MDQTEYILFEEMYSGRASSHVGPYKRKEYILCQEICCGRESSPVGPAERKALLPSHHHPGKGPTLEYPKRGVSNGPDRFVFDLMSKREVKVGWEVGVIIRNVSKD
ncbi:uncharacterized protein LOC106014061 isoform X2 [Aplysia californica]|uniref:Uncharacterized protein LOC106014061 isoform X2 n=1 Tax=Aplysia californica TaxID=6500 RepID=A0ABM1AFA0_APLCA|nr:uncharacterized protein LOC106014061 isoform X2 [Aplysia californica]